MASRSRCIWLFLVSAPGCSEGTPDSFSYRAGSIWEPTHYSWTIGKSGAVEFTHVEHSIFDDGKHPPKKVTSNFNVGSLGFHQINNLIGNRVQIKDCAIINVFDGGARIVTLTRRGHVYTYSLIDGCWWPDPSLRKLGTELNDKMRHADELIQRWDKASPAAKRRFTILPD